MALPLAISAMLLEPSSPAAVHQKAHLREPVAGSGDPRCAGEHVPATPVGDQRARPPTIFTWVFERSRTRWPAVAGTRLPLGDPRRFFTPGE